MLGKVFTKSKEFFPTAYKHKTGVLLSGTSLTIPNNIIPLTVYSFGGTAASTSTNTGGETSVHTNLGQIYGAGSPGGKSVGIPTVKISLFAQYSYNFDTLKTITSIFGYRPPSMGQNGTLPTLQVIEWLEKSGGGPKSTYKKLHHLFKKGGVKNAG